MTCGVKEIECFADKADTATPGGSLAPAAPLSTAGDKPPQSHPPLPRLPVSWQASSLSIPPNLESWECLFLLGFQPRRSVAKATAGIRFVLLYSTETGIAYCGSCFALLACSLVCVGKQISYDTFACPPPADLGPTSQSLRNGQRQDGSWP